VGSRSQEKRGNWRQVCASLEIILDAARTASPRRLDDVVKRELDRLWRCRNPNRGAWLSEMLCLFSRSDTHYQMTPYTCGCVTSTMQYRVAARTELSTLIWLTSYVRRSCKARVWGKQPRGGRRGYLAMVL